VSGAALWLGTWAFGGWFWGAPRDDDARLSLRAALDLGLTGLDTAPLYGFGRAERLIGELGDRTRGVTVATKCGLTWDEALGDELVEADLGGRDPQVRVDLSPPAVRRDCERSLRRLRRDHLDLLQTHKPDPSVPLADTLEALSRLIDEGKIGGIGLCNVSVRDAALARALLGDRLQSVQAPLNLLDRRATQALLPWCQANGVRYLAYSPLASGLLTGALTSNRTLAPGDKRSSRLGFEAERRDQLNEQLHRAPRPPGVTVAAMSLGWVAAQPGVSVVIVGVKTPHQLRAAHEATSRPASAEALFAFAAAVATDEEVV
jgi:aryl-alcohol dehydrogenase-like predicted oxidoreductase